MVRTVALVVAIVAAASGCELVVGDETRSVSDAAAEGTDVDAATSPDAPPSNPPPPAPADAAPPPPAADAGDDACTAPPSCLAAATTCGQKCSQAWMTCDQKDCKGGSCPSCDAQLAMCQSDCAAHCVSCSKCVDTSACAAAVQ